MDGNPRNHDYSDCRNLFGMRKTTYWEIYGVKRFPYHGKRKFTPLLSQSFDGGMVISNDVFGLTISQFERVYKACLERRKTKEQWILNLRYPDKSSKEYLEYLENCTDCNKDNLFWPGNDTSEKYLYEHLVKIVGTEVDIRKRQRLFIIKDIIANVIGTQISSGSLAEGLDLPGSDIDTMHVINHIVVTHNKRTHRTKPVMQIDVDHPGFARIGLEAANGEALFEPCGCCRVYLPVSDFLGSVKKFYPDLLLHGPCLTDKRQAIDFAYCIRSKYLPHNAVPWAFRHRLQWPPNFVIGRIIHSGCLLVPVGPKTISDSNLLWRLSFSVAEKILVHSFNLTQFLCYGLLKLTLKHIVNTNSDVKGLLCSYFMKTALFWVSEEEDINTFQLSRLFYCFLLCLDKLISWVNICYCPNYFIPENNMFLGKITPDNNILLINILESIKCRRIDVLMNNIFPPYNGNNNLLCSFSETSIIMLDFLFYKVCKITQLQDISFYYKQQTLLKTLLRSEPSSFCVGLCEYSYAQISKHAAQLLPSLTSVTTKENYNIHKRYHIHLQDGIKTDAVSGWLLYASFYYVTGQYNITLKLIDYVLSKCIPNMLFINCADFESLVHIYRQYLPSQMTLVDRMRIGVVDYVNYSQNSSLIPEELKQEVNETYFLIPPVVISHCLRFLCYHRLGDIFNRKQALRDLYLTVESKYLVTVNTFSNSLTILGVCLDISGDKDSAYECYDIALQGDYYICPSAEKRKSKLCDV